MASDSAISPTPTPSTAGDPPPPVVSTPLPAADDPAWPWLVGMLLILSFMTALVPIRNSDFLQHLALGRLLTQGNLPLGSDSLTHPGEVVTSAHPTWLFDLTIYLLYAVGGALLVLLVKAVLTVVLVEVQLRTAYTPKSRAAPLVLCVLLGLVVLGPYLLVQARFVSLILLALTIFLLSRYRSADELQAAPPLWTLPIVCLLWGNVDNWFFLGPLCIGLFSLGLLLEEYSRPERPKVARTLLLPLGLSLGAAFLNPGLFALRWDLPPELGLNGCLAFVGDLPGYAYLSASPLSGDYFRVTTGWSIAGQSYFLLMLLTLSSFPILGRRTPWSGFFVVLVLAVLSLYRVAAIPFFTVVAAPWLARNFLQMLAVQAEAGARPQSGGSLLAGLLLVVVALATYPGWLNAYPWTAYRFGIGMETDPGLREMAEKTAELGDWYREKTGQPSPTWLNTSPTAAHYIAWFAPGQRAYLDQRLLLSSAAARDYQSGVQAPFERLDDLEPIYSGQREQFVDRYAGLRGRGVKWVAFHQHDLIASLQFSRELSERPTLEERARKVPVVLPLLGLATDRFAGDWSILHLRGATSLFGLRYPASPGEKYDPVFDNQAENSRQRAFGDKALEAPRHPPVGDAEPRSWLTTFWSPEPLRSAHAQESAQYLLLFEATRRAYFVDQLREWQGIRNVLRGVNFGISAAGVPVWQSGYALAEMRDWLLSHEFPVGQAFLADKDRASPAALYLALRSTRRALPENPLDARAHLLLARAYYNLAHQTRVGYRSQGFDTLRILRRYQIIAAARAAVRLDPDLEEAHGILAETYKELNIVDLQLYHQREMLRLNVAAGPRPGEKPEDAEKRWKFLDEQVVNLRKKVEGLVSSFRVQTANLNAVQKAVIATQFQQKNEAPVGLAEEALTILASLKEEDLLAVVGGEALGLRLRLDVEFLHGNLVPVRDVLDAPNADRWFALHPSLGLPAFGWFRVCLGACAGDYDMADVAVAGLTDFVSREPEPKPAWQAMFVLAGHIGGLAGRTHFGPPPATVILPGAIDSPYALVAADGLARQALNIRGNEGSLLALRGCIALESGQTGKARELFGKVVEIAENARISFAAKGVALAGLDLLKRPQEAAK